MKLRDQISFLGELAKILGSLSASEVGGIMSTAGNLLRDFSRASKLTESAIRRVRSAYDPILAPLAQGPLLIEDIINILDLSVQSVAASSREEFLSELQTFLKQRFGATLTKETSTQ